MTTPGLRGENTPAVVKIYDRRGNTLRMLKKVSAYGASVVDTVFDHDEYCVPVNDLIR